MGARAVGLDGGDAGAGGRVPEHWRQIQVSEERRDGEYIEMLKRDLEEEQREVEEEARQAAAAQAATHPPPRHCLRQDSPT